MTIESQNTLHRPITSGPPRLPLESVIITSELNRRGSRRADYEAENRALESLIQEMANPSGNVLQKLVDTALHLCRGHSAGMSILDTENGRKIFKWRALAGKWSRYLGSTMPREISLCGTVLDRNSALLLSRPERHYPLPPGISPPVAEVLLIPFHVAGEAVGTMWVVAHDASRQFDAEDERLMSSLGKFAAAAYQVLTLQSERKRTEDELRCSEAQRAGILESIGEAFFAFDKDLRFTYVNRQAERLLDRAPGDLIGKVIWEMYPGLLGSEFQQVYSRAVSEQKASSVTAFYPDHNRWYEVHAYPAPDGITVYFRNVTERLRAEEELRRARDELEVRVAERTQELQRANNSLLGEIAERKRSEAARVELLQRLEDAQEEERRRISREMHDSLGQHLTALTIGLKTVQTRESCSPTVREHIEQLRATALKLDEEIDRLSHELRPLALDDLGLGPALRRHAHAWSQESGIAVEVHIRNIESERLPATIETTAYRIAQEAFTNIRKHAHATQVSLIAERHDDELRIIIEDNGGGFDPDQTLAIMDARRLGLKGMSERAALVAGQLEIESAPGQGATIYLAIPLSAPA